MQTYIDSWLGGVIMGVKKRITGLLLSKFAPDAVPRHSLAASRTIGLVTMDNFGHSAGSRLDDLLRLP